MKITFDTLTFKNFKSYGNQVTTINFDQLGTCMIVGENLDDTSHGIMSNGTGKTTIIDALAYACYDKPVSKIKTKDKLINNINNRDMEVTLSFHNDIGDRFFVKRVRGSKSNNGVWFYVNDQDKTVDVAGTNALIEQALTMPYEAFVHMVVFSATHPPFLELPTSAASGMSQRSIIEDLFKMTELSERAEVLKAQIKETENAVKVAKSRIEVQEREIARHTELLNAAIHRRDTWSDSVLEQSTKLAEDIKRATTIDYEEQERLLGELDIINKQLDDAKNEKQQLVSANKMLTTTIATIERELDALRKSECPRCHQHYADAVDEIDVLSTKLTALQEELSAGNEELPLFTQKVELLSAKVVEINNMLVCESINDLYQQRSSLSVMRSKLESLVEAENPHIDTVKELEQSVPPPVDYGTIDQLDTTLTHQKFLLKLLTKSDSFIRKALVNQHLVYLNARIREYLTEMKLPHKVEILEDLSPSITTMGRELDFGNLSAGQAARVNFALSMAFRDVRNRLNNQINVCLCDEVLDHGLDAVGVQSAARILRNKAKQDGIAMFVISHREEMDSVFDRVLRIQFKDGFSQLVDPTVS